MRMLRFELGFVIWMAFVSFVMVVAALFVPVPYEPIHKFIAGILYKCLLFTILTIGAYILGIVVVNEYA